MAAVLLLAPLQACGIGSFLGAQESTTGGSATWSQSLAPQGPTPVPAVHGNPFLERDQYVASDSAAARAAMSGGGPAESDLLFRLADVPAAIWLLPETHPSGTVGPYVEGVVQEAQSQGRVAVFVAYGVPGRDCIHSHSAGGTGVEEYVPWIREISDAAGRGSVLVLEPDALASLGDCPLDHDRTALMADAVAVLADGPVTYVDAGHSGWESSGTMASRLRAVGVDRVRGFSLNVAGYGSVDRERAYGDALAGQTGGAHFVVDVGRAGAGTASTWCNPAGQAVGPLPGAVEGQGALDAHLWVKPPGESDGECGGGPAAGEFWSERAVEMMRAAQW